jgi:hypothetical protein
MPSGGMSVGQGSAECRFRTSGCVPVLPPVTIREAVSIRCMEVYHSSIRGSRWLQGRAVRQDNAFLWGIQSLCRARDSMRCVKVSCRGREFGWSNVGLTERPFPSVNAVPFVQKGQEIGSSSVQIVSMPFNETHGKVSGAMVSAGVRFGGQVSGVGG